MTEENRKMSDDTSNGMKKPPGPNPGDVLHQRRSLGRSPAAMAAGGLLIIAAIGYFALYTESKPGAGPAQVAKVVTDDTPE